MPVIFCLFLLHASEMRGQEIGTILTVAGNGGRGYSGDGGPATSAMLNAPTRLVLDPQGNILIADLVAPLFLTSDGQLNVQLPAELPPSTIQQAYVRVRLAPGIPEAVSVPKTVTLAPARPGLFSINQQGTGQGAILNAQGQLVDNTAPVAAGEVIQIFATGLGPTQPAVLSGHSAPAAEPLARVTGNVEVRIAGQSAHVDFAGLAPNFVGLYQVNVQVPSNAPTGDVVEVVLTIDGVTSNTVTIAVQ